MKILQGGMATRTEQSFTNVYDVALLCLSNSSQHQKTKRSIPLHLLMLPKQYTGLRFQQNPKLLGNFLNITRRLK